jgi:arylsulfatase A-like enzyme
MGLIIAMGMPPLTWFSARTVFMEPPLGLLLGMFLTPLHLLRRGRFIHPAMMALIWIGMERSVAVDPDRLQMWLLPPLVGLLFFYGLEWLWKKQWKVVLAAAAAAPVLLLLAPMVHYKMRGGYDVKAVKRLRDAPQDAPDVVFLVMDTVRAHNVSAYGYERETTPRFDAFAKEGTLFENAMAPGTWSLPAHASLFTGTLPSIHEGNSETNYLDDKLPTLAQALAESGFETRCFTANPHLSPGFGLTRGFGWTDNAWLTGAGGRGFTFIYRLVDALGFTAEDKGGGTVVRNVANWLAQRPRSGPPAFVFINFLEAHFPFHQLPERFRHAYTHESLSHLREFGQLAFGAQTGRQLSEAERKRIHQPILDLYDGGIKYTDYLLGQIIDLWKTHGSLDDTVFVVVADHGEHTGEHKMYGHVTSVYQEDLAVPLMFRYPKKIAANRRVAQEVSTLGIFATLFDLLGLETPKSVQWGSLMPAMMVSPAAAPRPFGRPVMAERFEKRLLSSRFGPGEANGEGPLLMPGGRYRVYRIGKYKLVKHFANGTFTQHLFNLDEDPGELTDLASQPEYHSALLQVEQELRSWEAVLKLPALQGGSAGAVAGSKDNQPSDEAKEQLRALGYME